jgi:nucleotide-binding universal stress UspA family protein
MKNTTPNAKRSSQGASQQAPQNAPQDTLHVVACIDGSRVAPAVCDYAAWASKHMDSPLTLLHVLDEERYPSEPDLAGNIGLGSREHLLDELAELDRKRSKIALEHGNHMLENAEQRVKQAGISDIKKRQRHGDLTESLLELQEQTRLLVMGLYGESSSDRDVRIGSQLETVIRSISRPILLVPDNFSAPQSSMLAFDGSATAFRGVEHLAASQVLRGMPLHLVMAGEESPEAMVQLRKAEAMLAPLEAEIILAIRSGEVEQVLHKYQDEHNIDLLVMGAYGHSKIRRFLLGSTTTKMLKTAKKPLVILR